MDYLPLLLDVRGQRCLVVGGGEAAARKITQLLEAGARVTCIAPGLCPAVRELAEAGAVSHVASRFMPEYLQDAHLAVAATGDAAVNQQVSEAAKAMRIPVNVVDAPRLCTFVMPAAVETSAVPVPGPHGTRFGAGADEVTERGVVHLVGAGPGNPDLLTLRAVRVMQQADVVVYDSLIGEGILDLVRRDAERIYVGKRCNRHSMSQEEINKLLVRLGSAGKRVVRLKGGDPFLFGRGGEEIEALSSCGVAFEVVPGITAASGCAGYAGIPLTHRDHARSCVFVTGHLKDGTVNLDWEALARPQQTVVVYMGLGSMPEICRQLVRHGLPAATPAAAVQSATTDGQRVVTGTLQTLPDLVAAVGLASPALLIVGEVVKLHRRFAWYSPGPRAQAVPSASGAPQDPQALDPAVLQLMQRHTT